MNKPVPQPDPRQLPFPQPFPPKPNWLNHSMYEAYLQGYERGYEAGYRNGTEVNSMDAEIERIRANNASLCPCCGEHWDRYECTECHYTGEKGHEPNGTTPDGS